MTHSWESFVDEPCPVVLQTLNNRLQPPPHRLFDQARYQCFQEVALILLHLVPRHENQNTRLAGRGHDRFAKSRISLHPCFDGSKICGSHCRDRLNQLEEQDSCVARQKPSIWQQHKLCNIEQFSESGSVLLLAYGVFRGSKCGWQDPSLPPKSESKNPCLRCEIVSRLYRTGEKNL